MTSTTSTTGVSADDLVRVENLSVKVAGPNGRTLLDSVSLSVQPGRLTALVGESGAGKSMTTKAILGVLDDRRFTVTGDIEVCGEDVSRMSPGRRRRYLAKVAALVFQNPKRALDPTMRVGPQIAEALRFAPDGPRLSGKEAHERAVELMRQVGIAAPEVRYFAFPHQMSGGMMQRAVIAIALSLNPRVLFCDEPTSSLDVTTQALIMDLLDELRERLGIGILFITHDLVLAGSRADDVMVLHSGRIVERLPAKNLFASAAMPYTRDLIARVPGQGAPHVRRPALPAGTVLGPQSCGYALDCALATELCLTRTPPLALLEPDHVARCWYPIGHEPLDPPAIASPEGELA